MKSEQIPLSYARNETACRLLDRTPDDTIPLLANKEPSRTRPAMGVAVDRIHDRTREPESLRLDFGMDRFPTRLRKTDPAFDLLGCREPVCGPVCLHGKERRLAVETSSRHPGAEGDFPHLRTTRGNPGTGQIAVLPARLLAYPERRPPGGSPELDREAPALGPASNAIEKWDAYEHPA